MHSAIQKDNIENVHWNIIYIFKSINKLYDYAILFLKV